MAQKHSLEKQWAAVRRWVDATAQVPEVDVIWVEGSLADAQRATPGSDVDLRLTIADEAFEQLWDRDRTPLLKGLGEHMLLQSPGFIRALTADGVVVEVGAYRTSRLQTLALFEWEFLFCRLPGGEPRIQKLPRRRPAEVWPEKEEMTADRLRSLTSACLLSLAQSPSVFYHGEILSAWATADRIREDLLKLLYRRAGVRFAMRCKHLSEVFPPDFLSDLENTHPKAGEIALEPSTVARLMLRVFEIMGRHLQALSDQVGGGFEADWYWRLYSQVKDELRVFMNKGEAQ